MDELWDIARVAEYLGVSERTVYTKVRSGDLPAIRVGRLWRVRESDLRAWLGEAGGCRAGVSKTPAPPRPSNAITSEPGPYPYSEDTASLAAESGAIPERAELERLLDGVSDVVERRMAFVGMLTRGVKALGWSAPVIVGGYAVQYYTAGDYPTVDIDLAGASEPVGQVLGTWGFEREGRHWYDEALNIVVEVPGGQLEPDELAHVAGVEYRGVTAYVLGIEDLIVDRLAACVFWKDQESCLWARTLLQVAPDLDEPYLIRRAIEADVVEKLNEIQGLGL